MQASQTLAFFPNLGWPEIVVILVVFILLFGAKKLPELARGVGKAMKEFKKATTNIEDDFRNAMDEEPTPPASKKSIDATDNVESSEKTTSNS